MIFYSQTHMPERTEISPKDGLGIYIPADSCHWAVDSTAKIGPNTSQELFFHLKKVRNLLQDLPTNRAQNYKLYQKTDNLASSIKDVLNSVCFAYEVT